MERKTKVDAEAGRQDLLITREFDLPLDLLFRAYAEPGIVEQWMGTKVLKMDNRPHGGYRFETKGGDGKILFAANGTIHEFLPEAKITRTFQMENAPFPVQLEFLEFEALDGGRSRLTIHIVYKSIASRDQVLQLPFAMGINMAHNRLQDVMNALK